MDIAESDRPVREYPVGNRPLLGRPHEGVLPIRVVVQLGYVAAVERVGMDISEIERPIERDVVG